MDLILTLKARIRNALDRDDPTPPLELAEYLLSAEGSGILDSLEVMEAEREDRV